MTTRQYRAANPHRTGHYAGLHPEDQPYISDDLDDDDTRSHTSAIRYAPRQSSVVYYGPPPVKRKSRYPASQQPAPARTRWQVHWLVYMGLFFLVGITGWLAITVLDAWWQAKQDDWTYGMPRTYQTSAVVGHGDSASHPSHFIAQNLNGEIVVIEYPAGDVTKARSYMITTLPGDDGYSPVRVAFKALTGDGRLDMLVQIGDPGTQVQVILYNNGQQFAAKP